MSLPIGAVGRAAAAVTEMPRHPPAAAATHPFAEVLGERAGPPPAAPPPALHTGPARGPAAAAPPAAPPGGPATLRRVLVDLVAGERKLDGVVKAAMSGRDFTVQELIGIQAAVFRHSQEMEVVSRLVDRLTGTIKTTLQTQV
jgi:hypothetical protein